jgi:hypothetical protein
MVKNKKAVSAVIGYVLLITFGIIMSVIVYNNLKTYVPTEALKCPDGISIVLQDYDCSSNQLNITLKNNGKFNLAGFFIHASNNSNQNLATLDLSKNLDENESGKIYGSAVVVSLINENLMTPGDENGYIFENIPSNIALIEFIPTRFQEENNKIRFVSCTDAKITEKINCD